MSFLGIINDGYTENGYIAEHKRLYPAVRFTFRPMLIAELVEYGRAVDKLKGMEVRRYVAQLLKDKISSWDLVDAKGESVPVNVANFLKLKASLFDKLFGIVSVQIPSDDDPDAGNEEMDQRIKDALALADDDKKSLVEVREDRAVKN